MHACTLTYMCWYIEWAWSGLSGQGSGRPRLAFGSPDLHACRRGSREQHHPSKQQKVFYTCIHAISLLYIHFQNEQSIIITKHTIQIIVSRRVKYKKAVHPILCFFFTRHAVICMREQQHLSTKGTCLCLSSRTTICLWHALLMTSRCIDRAVRCTRVSLEIQYRFYNCMTLADSCARNLYS